MIVWKDVPLYIFAFGEYKSKQVNVNGIQHYKTGAEVKHPEPLIKKIINVKRANLPTKYKNIMCVFPKNILYHMYLYLVSRIHTSIRVNNLKKVQRVQKVIWGIFNYIFWRIRLIKIQSNSIISMKINCTFCAKYILGTKIYIHIYFFLF